MRYIYFSLSRDIKTKPPIIDGEIWKVYTEFNTDTQVWELLLQK